MKKLKVGQKLKLSNGDDVKIYEVIERNDDAIDPPEYQFKNVETGEKHGPVLWNWLKEGELIND